MSPRWTVTPSWKRVRPPKLIAPCLPVLVDNVPAGPDWIHELKWGGYRIIARKEGSSVRLWSRTGRGWHPAFPGIVEAIAALPATSLILDGEAAPLRNDGSDADSSRGVAPSSSGRGMSSSSQSLPERSIDKSARAVRRSSSS